MTSKFQLQQRFKGHRRYTRKGISRPIAEHKMRLTYTSSLLPSFYPLSRLSAIMVFYASALLLAASILSVGAISTSAPAPTSATSASPTAAPPHGSTPSIGNSPLPLTQYSFTYPNLVRTTNWCKFHKCAEFFLLSLAGASQSIPCRSWSSVWL